MNTVKKSILKRMYFCLGFLPLILPESWAATKYHKIKDSKVLNSILPMNYEKLWLKYVVRQIVYEIQPRGATIWIMDGSALDRRLTYFVVREFSKRLPTLQIDVLSMNKTGNFECLRLPQIERPGATINVVLMKQAKSPTIMEKQLRSFFESVMISGMDYYSPNPKILIVIYGAGQTQRQIDSFWRFCDWAWEQKILDLTFIYVRQKRTAKPAVAFVLPFKNINFAWNFDKHLILFPDKLKNMYKNPVSISLGEYSNVDIEAQKLDRHKVSFRMNMVAGDFIFLKYYFCAVHNCVVFIGDYNDSNFRQGNFLLKFSGYLSSRRTCLGSCTTFVDITAAIPQLDAKSDSQYKYSNMVFFFFFISMFILLLKGFVKAMGLAKSEWSTTSIFLCILGAPVEFRQGLRANIFYLALIALSCYISNDLIDIATEFELDEKRIVVDSFEALDQMNVPIYSRFSASYLFDNHQSLTSKHVQMEDTQEDLWECMAKLRTHNDRICVDIDQYIESTNAIVAKSDGKDLGLRKLDFIIDRQCTVTLFEERSPYFERYDLLTLRALDHGLLRRPTIKEFLDSQGLEYDERDCNTIPNDSADFYWSLFHVIAAVYGLAVVTFLIEIFFDGGRDVMKRIGNYDYKKWFPRCPRLS